MREDIKQAWIADLERDDIKQGTGVLRNGWDEYCCLGRLCEVVKDFDVNVISFKDDPVVEESQYWYSYQDSEDYELLPVALAKELGMTVCGDITYTADDGNEVRTSLADLNDSGKTFKEIAEIIRKSDL